MATRIVTISHAGGALGQGIGHSVADRLGFRYVDEEIIELAANKHGLDAALLADVERRKGLLARILDELTSAPIEFSGDSGSVMADAVAVPRREELRALIIEAIREIAERGNVVIVSHAAGIPLAGRDDVLRVFVTASFDTRALRLAESQRREDRAEAAKLLADSDAARADYFLRFYRIERELPTHYDLVVNTDKLTADEATDIVVAAAQARRGAPPLDYDH